jgi:hypothetical protein
MSSHICGSGFLQVTEGLQLVIGHCSTNIRKPYDLTEGMKKNKQINNITKIVICRRMIITSGFFHLKFLLFLDKNKLQVQRGRIFVLHHTIGTINP